MATVTEGLVCYGCGATNPQTCFRYEEPPEGETRFSFSTPQQYRREVVRCERCGHFMSNCDMDISEMYSSEYVDSTYGAKGYRGDVQAYHWSRFHHTVRQHRAVRPSSRISAAVISRAAIRSQSVPSDP